MEHLSISSLMLAGKINILNLHDTIAALEERVQANEIENVTRNASVESLENWILKQEEARKHLEGKFGELNTHKPWKLLRRSEFSTIL